MASNQRVRSEPQNQPPTGRTDAAHPVGLGPFAHLLRAPASSSARSSSWDRTGANEDYVRIGPGARELLLDAEGPGCIDHLYVAFGAPEITDYRDAILRCWWDGEATPSVEVPLGDFFGLAHARIREVRTACTAVNPGMGASHGLNAYLPMPFAAHARIEIENRADTALGGMLGSLWFHVDWERYDEPLPDGTLRFHAQYRQERPTVAATEPANTTLHSGTNLDGAENYVALEATGPGQMVGLLLEIENLGGDWYGEGDDMVFVDGDTWPPRIHGTGTEEVFGGGACPLREYSGPSTGFHLVERTDYGGLVGMYRWYVADPIRFRESLRWTIEHGHANNYANGYASVAYWYQAEPHDPFPPLPGRDDLRPPLPDDFDEIRSGFIGAVLRRAGPTTNFESIARFAEPYFRGEFHRAMVEIAAQGLA